MSRLRSMPPRCPAGDLTDEIIREVLYNQESVRTFLAQTPTEGDVWRAMMLEYRGRGRHYIITELHSRANRMRLQRERVEVLP